MATIADYDRLLERFTKRLKDLEESGHQLVDEMKKISLCGRDISFSDGFDYNQALEKGRQCLAIMMDYKNLVKNALKEIFNKTVVCPELMRPLLDLIYEVENIAGFEVHFVHQLLDQEVEKIRQAQPQGN